MAHTQKNIKIIFLAVLLTKLHVLIINLAKKLFFTEEHAVYRFIEAILEDYDDYCKKMEKKYFNKNIIITAEEEEKFQLTNSCCICDKLFNVGDDKVRDHCHITGKYGGAAYWSCNISLKISKKLPIIFHNL